MQPDIRIVIAPRGWVFVGLFSRRGAHCTVDGGFVVRTWGTSKGLGELALLGPLERTVLDPAPCIELPSAGIIATLRCDAAKWQALCRASGDERQTSFDLKSGDGYGDGDGDAAGDGYGNGYAGGNGTRDGGGFGHGDGAKDGGGSGAGDRYGQRDGDGDGDGRAYGYSARASA